MERPRFLLNARNVTLVTILAAASAATIYLLNAKPVKTKKGKNGAIIYQNGSTRDKRAIDGMSADLKSRRETILRKFEENKHQSIPKEMTDAMTYIQNEMKIPRAYPPQIRLLCSQLIQDYAIMVTNVKTRKRDGKKGAGSLPMSPEPPPSIVNMAKVWLDFVSNDVSVTVEQINHRYALALRSRSIREFALLSDWLKTVGYSEDSLDDDDRKRDDMYDHDADDESDCSDDCSHDDEKRCRRIRRSRRSRYSKRNLFESNIQIQQNLILRNFQCACLLGNWDDVISYGEKLEKIKPELLATQNGQSGGSGAASSQSSQPLHPLHLFEYIALKLPNQSANFTQTYYNAKKYKSCFGIEFQAPLKFTEWQIHDCTTQLIEATSSSVDRQRELMGQIAKAKTATRVKSLSRFMFLYGSLVQFPCFWVQLPAGPSKVQPVVLCGPWNEADVEMTASYVRRYTANGKGGAKKKRRRPSEVSDDDPVQVVRSDLRLTLSRGKFNDSGVLSGSIGGSSGSGSVMVSSNKRGWEWEGLFDHVEGLLTLREGDLTSFSFRKQPVEQWIRRCSKFTRRSWKIRMILATGTD